MKYLERPCAGGCGATISTPWPTCGTLACRRAHQREVNRINAKARYDRLVAEGRCGKCGHKIPETLRSKSTQQPVISRCAVCLAKVRKTQQGVRDRQRAALKRQAAVRRVAENAIQRMRNNAARVEAGMDPSFSTGSTRLPQGIVEIQEI